MTYNFTSEDIQHINKILSNVYNGPHAAFIYYHKLDKNDTIPPDDIKDFILSYYECQNRRNVK